MSDIRLTDGPWAAHTVPFCREAFLEIGGGMKKLALLIVSWVVL